MASRLSEQSLIEKYDQGKNSFYIEGLSPKSGPLEEVKKSLLGQTVDLDGLLLQENPEEAVAAVPAQDLYHALMIRGAEDCMDVLPLISSEQLVRIFDYDVWTKDELEPQKMVRWLELYGELGTEELVNKFRGLDEEYQTAFLSPLIRIVDEDEFEKLSDQEQDRYTSLPCGQLHYSIGTENPKLLNAVENLIQAALSQDINYAYSLLTHGAYLPPLEQEEILKQMRQARLEEDGFVTFQESYQYFLPLSVNEQTKELPRLIRPLELWQVGEPLSALRDVAGTGGTGGDPKGRMFLDVVISSLNTGERDRARQLLLTLANALCSAAQVEPDDLKGAEAILTQGQALTSLALEWVSEGQVNVASQYLLTKGPKLCFRLGISLVHQYTAMVLKSLEAAGVVASQEVLKNYFACKYGLAIHKIETEWLAIFGFEQTEWLKGLVNRFPLRFSHKMTTGGDDGTMVFKPISSLRVLRELAEEVATFIEGLHSHQGFGEGKPFGKRPLDLN